MKLLRRHSDSETKSATPPESHIVVTSSVWIVLLCLAPILFCGSFFGAFALSEPLARSMTPPIYPNAQLVVTERATGSWGYTEFSRYSTADSMASVDNWYTNNAAKFRRVSMNTGGIAYENVVSDSLVANIIGYLNGAGWGDGPSGGLTIYPDLKKTGSTQITVSIAWPSP